MPAEKRNLFTECCYLCHRSCVICGLQQRYACPVSCVPCQRCKRKNARTEISVYMPRFHYYYLYFWNPIATDVDDFALPWLTYFLGTPALQYSITQRTMDGWCCTPVRQSFIHSVSQSVSQSIRFGKGKSKGKGRFFFVSFGMIFHNSNTLHCSVFCSVCVCIEL